MPLFSIIIPCYKTELTLNDTLESVLKQDFEDWEALIINDGSPDNLEAVALKWVKKDNRFKYFIKKNGGLASARNFGIENSVGKYVLPLDSDNMVETNYLSKALPFLENDNNLGVVYGNAQYFGERKDIRTVGDYDKLRLLYQNYIDACAIIRREVFIKIGLYDTLLPHQGHEDWEFWIRLLNSKFTFLYIPEVVFKYRVTKNSMIRSFSSQMENENISYIRNKHKDIYLDAYNDLYVLYENYKLESKKTILQRIRRKFKKFI